MAEAPCLIAQDCQDPSGSVLQQVPRRAWMLLALEALLLGAGVLVYIALRDQRPEVVRDGRRYLDAAMGAGGAALILAGGLSMLGAAWTAHRGRRRGTILLLAVASLAGAGFLGVKGLEYDARWRRGLYWAQPYHRAVKAELRRQRLAKMAAPAAPAAVFTADAGRGKTLYMDTCAACHGVNAMGMPKLGLPLPTSKFAADLSDDGLLAFLKVGRGPADPTNTTGVAMPPRGGNPTLTDEKLRDIIAYLRQLEKEAPSAAAAVAAASGTPEAATAAPHTAAEPEPLLIPHTISPPAAAGPMGLSPGYLARHMTIRQLVDARQARLDEFFTVCLGLIGTHGLGVLAGLVITILLLWRTARRPLSERDAGLLWAGVSQWLLAAGIWLILFPLLYLS